MKGKATIAIPIDAKARSVETRHMPVVTDLGTFLFILLAFKTADLMSRSTLHFGDTV